jgi:hypothetical protein
MVPTPHHLIKQGGIDFILGEKKKKDINILIACGGRSLTFSRFLANDAQRVEGCIAMRLEIAYQGDKKTPGRCIHARTSVEGSFLVVITTRQHPISIL